MLNEVKKANYLEFFNLCGFDIDELPQQAVEHLRYNNYRNFIVPQVILDRVHNQMTLKELLDKYDLTTVQIHSILYQDAKKPFWKAQLKEPNK